MYGWGGDTSSWRGSGSYDYDSARSPYLDKLSDDAKKRGPRSYVGSRKLTKLVDPKGKEISSDSENPIIMAVDVTGSMQRWPAEIFDRVPLFYQTLSQYREDAEFAFGAIGDAYVDSAPLQINNFGKGIELEDHIKAIYPEGGGGGQISESYELFAHFINEHCSLPKAKNPFLFILGDEKFYDTILPRHVKHYIGDDIESEVKTQDVWDSLNRKFNLYFLHKPYSYGGDKRIDREVVDHWSKAIGEQRVIELPSADRAVDIAMGIVAKHWGQYGDFDENLAARQPDSVRETVHHSIRYVPDAGSTKSTLVKSGSKKSTSTLSEMYDSAKGGK